MADNKKQIGKADRIRINFHELYEVKYWTQKWNISTPQLHGAPKATGSDPICIAGDSAYHANSLLTYAIWPR